MLTTFSKSITRREQNTQGLHVNVQLRVGYQHNLFRGSQNLAEECIRVLRPSIVGVNHEYLHFSDRLIQ